MMTDARELMRTRSKTLLVKVLLIAVPVSLGAVVLCVSMPSDVVGVVLCVSMPSDVVGVLGLVAGNSVAEINI